MSNPDVRASISSYMPVGSDMATNESTIEDPDIDEMSAYLAGTEVTFALLFGSYARGTTETTSDVDVALRFPEDMDAYERFHCRNRIDVRLQKYAENFVDVSDIDSLPITAAYAALRDGIILVGDTSDVEAYRTQVEQEYFATKEKRDRAGRKFIRKLARGEDAEQARREYRQTRQGSQ